MKTKDCNCMREMSSKMIFRSFEIAEIEMERDSAMYFFA